MLKRFGFSFSKPSSGLQDGETSVYKTTLTFLHNKFIIFGLLCFSIFSILWDSFRLLTYIYIYITTLSLYKQIPTKQPKYEQLQRLNSSANWIL